MHAGLVYAVDGLKSVILTLATAARIINIPEAVSLSRLEEEYQVYSILISFMINVDKSPFYSLLFILLLHVCDTFLLYVIIFFYA